MAFPSSIGRDAGRRLLNIGCMFKYSVHLYYWMGKKKVKIKCVRRKDNTKLVTSSQSDLCRLFLNSP